MFCNRFKTKYTNICGEKIPKDTFTSRIWSIALNRRRSPAHWLTTATCLRSCASTYGAVACPGEKIRFVWDQSLPGTCTQQTICQIRDHSTLRRKNDDQHHHRKFLLHETENADCRGHDLHDLKKDCSIYLEGSNIVVTHRHPLMNVKAVCVTKCAYSLNSLSRPKLLKGHRRRTAGGRWVAAQKPSQQHLAGETSLLGATRSPTTVARAPWRNQQLSISSWAKVQSQPRSNSHRGNGSSRAQWKTLRSDADLASLAPRRTREKIYPHFDHLPQGLAYFLKIQTTYFRHRVERQYPGVAALVAAYFSQLRQRNDTLSEASSGESF